MAEIDEKLHNVKIQFSIARYLFIYFVTFTNFLFKAPIIYTSKYAANF